MIHDAADNLLFQVYYIILAAISIYFRRLYIYTPLLYKVVDTLIYIVDITYFQTYLSDKHELPDFFLKRR